MFDCGDVGEHEDAGFFEPCHDGLWRTNASDHHLDAMPKNRIHMIIEIIGSHDEIGTHRSGCSGIFGKSAPNVGQPSFKSAVSVENPGIHSWEGANDASPARGNDQVRPGYVQHRSGDDRQAETITKTLGKPRA